MILGILGIILFGLTVLFFNGSQVKGPLSAYLSSKSNLEVSIEDAEFSPLYPNIIKLYGVSFGQSRIGELYIEYDLGSALSNDELKIKDLYLNKINIEPNDLLSLATSKLGFKSIFVQTVRFHSTPLRTTFLSAPNSSVRLESVSFSAEEGLTFKAGALSTGPARLFNDEIKSFNIDFEHSTKGIAIKNFSLGILGGTVTGRGCYNLKHVPEFNPEDYPDQFLAHQKHGPESLSADIILDELNLSNVIISEGINAPKNVTLTATKTSLHDVIFTNDSFGLHRHISPKEPNNNGSNVFVSKEPTLENQPKQQVAHREGESQDQYLSYIMQGINGSIDELKIDSKSVTGIFQGHIDEISFPNLQTSFENNNTDASFNNNKLEFALQGQLYEGNYSTAGNFDLKQKHLNLTDLKLHKNKLALTRPRLNFIQKQFADASLFIKNAQFSQLEFLSYINTLPLSVQSISGKANNIFVHPARVQSPKQEHVIDKLYEVLAYVTLDTEAKENANENSLNLDKNKFIVNPDIYVNNFNKRQFLKDDDVSTLKLKLINMLYSDLLMSDTDLTLTLSEQGLAVDLENMRFKESSLNAQSFLALNQRNLSKLTISAQDFESADLNSNLIGHMLTGKFDLHVDLESAPHNKELTYNNLITTSVGTIELKSNAMLIADLGLDLINGGKKANYKLTGTELLSAIQGSVAGINNLDTHAKLNQGVANISSTAALVSSLLSLNSTWDLNKDTVSGRAFLISRTKDSSTQVVISGTNEELKFDIKALKRGEKRPGLYLPQYEASAHAKERTDAAAVLKGLITIPTVTAPAPNLVTSSEPLKEPQASENTTQDTAAPVEQDKTSKAPDTNKEPQAAEPTTQDTAAPVEQDKTSKEPDTTEEPQAAEATTQDTAAPEEQDKTSKEPDTTEEPQDAEPANQDTAAHVEQDKTSKAPDTKEPQASEATTQDSVAPVEQDKTSKAQDTTKEPQAAEPANQDTAAPVEQDKTSKAPDTIKEPQASEATTQDSVAPVEQDKTSKAPDTIKEPQASEATTNQDTAAPVEQDKTSKAPDTINEPQAAEATTQDSAATVELDKTSKAPDTTKEPQDAEPTTQDTAAPVELDNTSNAPDTTKEPQDAEATTQDSAASVEQDKTSKEPDTTKEPQASEATTQDTAASVEQDKTSKAPDTKEREVTAKSADDKDSQDNGEQGAGAYIGAVDESGMKHDLRHEEMLRRQADATERELFKDALIDSILNVYDEEELIF